MMFLRLQSLLKQKRRKLYALMTPKKTDISNIRLVVKAFQERFPEKCKYEK